MAHVGRLVEGGTKRGHGGGGQRKDSREAGRVSHWKLVLKMKDWGGGAGWPGFLWELWLRTGRTLGDIYGIEAWGQACGG